MSHTNKKFLSIAKKELPTFCFMMWDYFMNPNFLDVIIAKNSILCHYGQHNLVFGNPNREVFLGFVPQGEFSMVYPKNWKTLIQEFFTDFKLLDQSASGRPHNTFLCMQLTRKRFNENKQMFDLLKPYKSHLLSDSDSDLLAVKRQIHLSSGFGGIGIIENKELAGVGFAPHRVIEGDIAYAIIRDIWVSPKYRKRGYGTDITAHLCDMIFQKNIKRIFLWVEKFNVHAVRIYEKLGFTRENEMLGNVCRVKLF